MMTSNLVLAQDKRVSPDKHVAQLVFWKPKSGQDQLFETGYKRHLGWHKANGETWSWYGWWVISGPHDGDFIDATFDHTWEDFGRSIKPAEDVADNNLHVYPFGDVLEVFKLACISDLTISDSIGLRSKFLRMITMETTDPNSGIKLLEKLKADYQARGAIKNLRLFQLIDGGDIRKLILLLGFDSYEAFGKAEGLGAELSALEAGSKTRVFLSVVSETLLYQAGMSLFPE
jgi:hypothetical protein